VARRPAPAVQPAAAMAAAWPRANWVLVVAAVSLALAGVFLVQYGVERGLLTPPLRVPGALLLGLLLIAAAEWVRRRRGGTGSDTATIPSALAGTGLVSLAAGLLAGHLLHGLFGAWPAFAGLVLVATTAVALGWFYRPFLAAAGVTGALAVPLPVAPETGAPFLFGYLALVVLVALLIDTVRRWGFVSVLGVAAGSVAAWAVWLVGGPGNGPGLIGFGLAVALAAASVPIRRWRPDHPGPSPAGAVFVRGAGPVSFPVGLAWGGFAAACLAACAVASDAASAGAVWAGIGGLGLLFPIAAIWLARAPGLADLGTLPALLFLFAIGLEGAVAGPLAGPFMDAAFRPAELPPPGTATLLTALALIGAAMAAGRGLYGAGLRGWATAAGRCTRGSPPR
jgi:uncharacterized membrane protein